ncbi:MAG: hypothetical protein AB7C89_06420 [Intestinibacillus sp.]
MGRGFQINATPPNVNLVSQNIPTTELESKNLNVSFSFSDFKCQSVKNDCFNNKFQRFSDYGKFVSMFLDKLSNFSNMSVQELKEGGKSTRCHIIDGKNLEMMLDIMLELGMPQNKLDQIEDFYELTISAANGRFMGYFVGTVFYIVFFDPHHLLYPNLKKSAHQDLCNSYDPWTEFLS